VNAHYAAVAQRAEGRCEYCRAPEQVFNFPFEVEHIRPRADGGDDSLDNLALACEACNLFKSAFMMGWDEIEQRNAPLFHPRQDRWEEHFHFDSETAQIRGLSAVGRATIHRLKMNADFQVRARRQWMRLDLYP
jgi:hypothetical protein